MSGQICVSPDSEESCEERLFGDNSNKLYPAYYPVLENKLENKFRQYRGIVPAIANKRRQNFADQPNRKFSSYTDLGQAVESELKNLRRDYPFAYHELFHRWITPNTPNDVAGDQTQSTSTSTSAATTAIVTTPVILEHFDSDEKHGDYDDAIDPMLAKDSATVELSQALYSHHMNIPSSNNSSPIPHRKRQFTIVPMKPINEEERKLSRRQGNEALGLVLSALYGKLLVVMGIAFPMSEVISTYIPPSFYDGFYLYLYFGSITFMICIYGNILRQKATRSVRCTLQRIHTMRSRLASGNSGVAPDVTSNDATERVSCDDSEGSCSESPLPSPASASSGRRHKSRRVKDDHHHLGSGSAVGNSYAGAYAIQRIHFGSFYLRMGAVAFGIGSMIYSGLEFGQYFELEPDTKCHNFMIALTPAVRMIFTFMQMYFIFLNSKMAVSKVRLGAQFGLMHMIGTNMCVWLNVLVQETRHEILHFYVPDNGTITYPGFHHSSSAQQPMGTITTPAYHHSAIHSETPLQMVNSSILQVTTTVASLLQGSEVLHRHKRGLKGPFPIHECRRSDIMGALVQNASPFLFPCTIEYSLICAAILYVMWKSMAKRRAAMNRSRPGHQHLEGSHMFPGPKRSPHHYSVDCARANKGLFLGIFVLVMTIISLILFFVLINRPNYQALATLEVNITELILYTTTTVAVLIGMCQMRELRYISGRNLELDNILLIVAQTGSFIYNVFTIIGGHFTMKKHTVLVLMTALASLIQLLFQTLFILDASKRSASTAEQARRKPGREVVTFLLVTNLAMWAINTLEKSRADSHPVQLKFYGVWAWTIITHISMPLAIFYRFHSTVCLCEIWKRAYKIKPSLYR